MPAPEGLELRDPVCGRTAEQFSAYDIHIDLEPGQEPTAQQRRDAVWEEEGTLDPRSGQFLCDDCYLRHGMPSSPRGWTATPANVAELFLAVSDMPKAWGS
jgi:hypothetical protein